MRKLLIALAALPLGGCAGTILKGAQADCVKFGFQPDTPRYADCVQERFTTRQQGLQRALAGMGSSMQNSAQATPMQPVYRAPRFLKSSYVSGMNRICLYDSMGSTEAVTIGAAQICPIN